MNKAIFNCVEMSKENDMNSVIAHFLSAHADYMCLGRDSADVVNCRALSQKRRELNSAALLVSQLNPDSKDPFIVEFVHLVAAMSRLDDAGTAVKVADQEASRCDPADSEKYLKAIEQADLAYERAQKDVAAAHWRLDVIAQVETFAPAFLAFVEWNAYMACIPETRSGHVPIAADSERTPSNPRKSAG